MRLCPPDQPSQSDRTQHHHDAAEEHHMGCIFADLTRSYRKPTTALLLTLGAALSPASAQAPASGHPIVAVLPLENNSGDASQDFFAGGMTDEIASALTAVQGLGVVARSSSFLLAPADRDVKTAAEKLNANHLVLGSARIVADRVRLNVRLVQAADGVALWS